MIAVASNTSSSPGAWSFVLGFAVIVSILLGLKGLGLLSRRRFTVHGYRSSLYDFAHQPTRGMFLVSFLNRGGVPVSFFDFEIEQPRLGAQALTSDGKFILSQGGAFYINGKKTGRIGPVQRSEALNIDSRRVTVDPQSAASEIFDLSMFELPSRYGATGGKWPAGFAPVLQFEDSFGGRYVVDEHGVTVGRYVYPHQAELDLAMTVTLSKGVTRTRWPFLPWWWSTKTEDYPH